MARYGAGADYHGTLRERALRVAETVAADHGVRTIRVLGDRLERTGIDHVEQIARVDDGAVAEFDQRVDR